MIIMYLGIVEHTALPMQMSRNRSWSPPWASTPLMATDGARTWDLRIEGQAQAFASACEEATEVVVDRIPNALAHLKVHWRPLDVVERALHLGLDLNADDLASLLQGRGIAPPPWHWAPPTPPWHTGSRDMPPQGALARQAAAVRQGVIALDQAQRAEIRDRGAPELAAMLTATAGPLDAVYRRMTLAGVRLDNDKRRRLATEGDQALVTLAVALRQAGLDQPQHDQAVTTWLRKLDLLDGTEASSWDDDALKRLEYSTRDPAKRALVGLLRRYRRLAVVMHEGWLRGQLDGPDGRIHPLHIAFAQPTGRTTTLFPCVSSLMKELRPLVLPDADDFGIFEVDYSGAEIGIAAAKFRDPTAKAMYDSGKAVAAMAQMLFPDLLGNVPLPEIKSRFEDQYDTAKIASYGSLYGMQAPRLAKTLGITRQAAEQISHRLATQVWPMVEEGLLAEAALVVRSRRSIITPGLYRHVVGITAGTTYRLRTIARNTPIQGLCAAVFRRACLYSDRAITPFGGRLLLPIHDSLVCTAPLSCLAEAATAVKQAMERAARDELGDFVQLQAEVAMTNPSAWSKKGRVDSFDRFLADPTFRL